MAQNVGYLGEFPTWAEKNVYSAVVVFYKCQLTKLIDCGSEQLYPYGFCANWISITNRRVLMFPAIMVYLSIPFCTYICFFFRHFDILLLGEYILQIVLCSWRLGPLSLCLHIPVKFPRICPFFWFLFPSDQRMFLACSIS